MTEKRRYLLNYFSRGEKLLWCSSVLLIIISFMIFDRENYLTLSTSLIGVTSLIFNAKGNPFGQVSPCFSSMTPTPLSTGHGCTGGSKNSHVHN